VNIQSFYLNFGEINSPLIIVVSPGDFRMKLLLLILLVHAPSMALTYGCAEAGYLIAAPFFLGGGIAAGATAPNAIRKKRIWDTKRSEYGNATTHYNTAHNNAESKRQQISKATQLISSLDCSLNKQAEFENYVRAHCDSNLFVDVSNPVQFLKDSYNIEFYQAQDSSSTSNEAIYRTETYTESEPYTCDMGYWGTCYDYNCDDKSYYDGCDSYSYSYSCWIPYWTTCFRDVEKTRQVFDYNRQTTTSHIRAGTAIRGSIQTSTGCSDKDSSLSVTGSEQQVSDTWDRSNYNHYQHTLTYATRLAFQFMLNKQILGSNNIQVDRSQSVSTVAGQLVNFLKTNCQSAYPAVTQINRTALEIERNQTITARAGYQQELPSLEQKESSTLSAKTQSNDAMNLAENNFKKAHDIAIGVSIGAGAVGGVVLAHIIWAIVKHTCAKEAVSESSS
jgi:hypothetical protein